MKLKYNLTQHHTSSSTPIPKIENVMTLLVGLGKKKVQVILQAERSQPLVRHCLTFSQDYTNFEKSETDAILR